MVLKEFIGILTDSTGISDPRMNRFLMKTPLQPITIIALYLLFIYKVGPKFMEGRKPFGLQGFITLYNIIQIVVNALIFIMSLVILPDLSLKCTPPAPHTPEGKLAVEIHYAYSLLKIFDLIETIVFVLRKKNKQISFLHVYHHVGMICASWISGKYFPGGQSLFVGLYNSFVHLIMYCYYLKSSFNGGQTLWWKKYVTLIQIVQHYLVLFSSASVVVNVNCTFPKPLMFLFCCNCLPIIYLFTKFYKDNYLTEKVNKSN